MAIHFRMHSFVDSTAQSYSSSRMRYKPALLLGDPCTSWLGGPWEGQQTAPWARISSGATFWREGQPRCRARWVALANLESLHDLANRGLRIGGIAEDCRLLADRERPPLCCCNRLQIDLSHRALRWQAFVGLQAMPRNPSSLSRSIAAEVCVGLDRGSVLSGQLAECSSVTELRITGLPEIERFFGNMMR